MRSIITIFSFLLIFSGCSGQKENTWNTVKIKSSAKDSFFYAIKFIDTSQQKTLELFNSSSAILVPERWGADEDFINEGRGIGLVLPCQCAFNNDTLRFGSVLAWEGGFAYVAEATKNKFTSYVRYFGKKRKWVMDGKEYYEEIKIPGINSELVITENLPLRENKIIYGWLTFETPEYFELDKQNKKGDSQKDKLRVYFSCKISPSITF